jgi:hypothetical protein
MGKRKKKENVLSELPKKYSLADWSMVNKPLMDRIGLNSCKDKPIEDMDKFASDVLELSKYFTVMIIAKEDEIHIALDPRGYHFQGR